VRRSGARERLVEVKSSRSGREDQRASGMGWKTAQLLCRARHALENNVCSITREWKAQHDQVRRCAVPGNACIRCAWNSPARNARDLDGKQYIEMDDDTSQARCGRVWTKADSVTLFDDFSYGGHRALKLSRIAGTQQPPLQMAHPSKRWSLHLGATYGWRGSRIFSLAAFLGA